jgi:hypothetical protein
MTQAAASSWLNKFFTKLKKLKQHFPLFFSFTAHRSQTF